MSIKNKMPFVKPLAFVLTALIGALLTGYFTRGAIAGAVGAIITIAGSFYVVYNVEGWLNKLIKDKNQ